VPSRCTGPQWAEAVARLEERVPISREVHVTYQRRPLPSDTAGHAELLDDTGRFAIAVSSSLSYSETVDVLIHELAHVLDWSPVHGYTQDHGPTWGIHYAYVYRRFHGVE